MLELALVGLQTTVKAPNTSSKPMQDRFRLKYGVTHHPHHHLDDLYYPLPQLFTPADAGSSNCGLMVYCILCSWCPTIM